MAVLMEEHGIPAVGKVPESAEPVFIPSACWLRIAPGILSTTRFVGMLLAGKEKLAVYDIGDGSMEWQVRAEGSLFYTKYSNYETKATGMILMCQDGKRNKTARNIIRQTMWSRRQLLSDICLERNKPTCWSRSPIKLRAQYEHVYLTTPKWFGTDIKAILSSEEEVQSRSNNGTELHDPAQGDYEKWPYRFFVNPATDLLKLVYFFSAVKDMNICLKKTIAQIEHCLPDGDGVNMDQPCKIYGLTLRLQRQLLSVIYDVETFGGSAERVANAHSGGKNKDSVVTLTITEPLPSMKRLTQAVEEHWKAMIHVAIEEAAQQRPLPYFDKAMVEIEIITPRGSNNAKLTTTWSIWPFRWLGDGAKKVPR